MQVKGKDLEKLEGVMSAALGRHSTTGFAIVHFVAKPNGGVLIIGDQPEDILAAGRYGNVIQTTDENGASCHALDSVDMDALKPDDSYDKTKAVEVINTLVATLQPALDILKRDINVAEDNCLYWLLHDYMRKKERIKPGHDVTCIQKKMEICGTIDTLDLFSALIFNAWDKGGSSQDALTYKAMLGDLTQPFRYFKAIQARLSGDNTIQVPSALPDESEAGGYFNTLYFSFGNPVQYSLRRDPDPAWVSPEEKTVIIESLKKTEKCISENKDLVAQLLSEHFYEQAKEQLQRKK